MLKDRTRWSLPIVLLAAIGATLCSLQGVLNAAPKADPSGATDRWEVLYIGDQRIGYARSTTENLSQGDESIVRTTNEMQMTVKRFGQTIQSQSVYTADETADGDLLGFTMELRNPPAGTTHVVGRVEGARLTIETTLAGRTQKRTMDWDPDVKGPAYEDEVLSELANRRGETRGYKTFLPELNKITEVRVTSDDYRQVKLLDGKLHQLMKVTMTQSALPTMPVRSFLNREGEALRSETDLLGMTLITYAVPREQALEAIAGGELDLAVNTLVRVAPIPNGHRTRRAVYRITTPARSPAGYFAPGETQQIREVDADTIELTVTAAEIPERETAARKNVADEYLSATRFLQVSDPQIQDHARKASAGELEPVRIALKMERYVYERLSKKNFSTALASAAEVAKSLEGDCTEHAVLLAAMLRAKKIPSRVVVGLVYITNGQSFGGHMWTEAFLNGRWIPLDATLGQGGIGAAHIKLAESSLADDAPAPIAAFLPLLDVLGRIQIEVVSADGAATQVRQP